jgi:hypothetical protein
LAAHELMPPFFLMNLSSGSEHDLYASAYRNARDHFDRVRWIRSAPDDRGKRLVVIRWAEVLDAQSVLSPLESTAFSGPPCDQIENGA